MGVTVLQQFPIIENRTGPQTIEFLTKRVVALGAVQIGQFLVDCETYISVPQLGKYCSLASSTNHTGFLASTSACLVT
ncbi:hypothetical protein HN011_007107 [Eciton burchellii]|nr:hypothetical protein HN011_007107 [Eciton burchellii]